MLQRVYCQLNQDFDPPKEVLLSSVNMYDPVFWMDGHGYAKTTEFLKSVRPEIILGFGSIDEVLISDDPLSNLHRFNHKHHNDWLLGYMSYDLKNDLEKLISPGPDPIGFEKLDFFCPRYLLLKQEDIWLFGYFPELESSDFEPLTFLSSLIVNRSVSSIHSNRILLNPDLNREQYLQICAKILDHIHRGDIYELNLCIHFLAKKASIDPIKTYLRLSDISPTPFAGFLKRNGLYLLCASPERYLAGDAERVISQPMKGTAPRDKDPVRDQQLQMELKEDAKERAENIMIVDLVRNDLSKFASKASVNVDELCGIHGFPKVWQMISTVSCIPKKNTAIAEMIGASFPMGSMTGAPKVRAMELIDQYERTGRGLYSGSMGFITPGGKFDFNVVIRSILYNSKTETLAFSAGSAITSLSQPEKEYAECMLKAASMAQSLGLDINEI